ncbi:MAG: rhodanese-like domain-containing protein [Adhaeribacter sp.]
MMKNRILYFFAFLLLLASCNHHKPTAQAHPDAAARQPAPARASTLNSSQAKALLQKQPGILILDVRTPGEFAGGHLAQARNLDFNSAGFENQLAALDKTKPYLVYCAVGGRSSKAASLMQQMGFQRIYNVSEGFPALKSAGIPTAF